MVPLSLLRAQPPQKQAQLLGLEEKQALLQLQLQLRLSNRSRRLRAIVVVALLPRVL